MVMASSQANTIPPWPSLYNPGLEILHIEHRGPTQAEGAYLYHPKDIFRFTFYWTLILYTPFFLLGGAYAFWNYTFPPSPPPRLTRPRPAYTSNSKGVDIPYPLATIATTTIPPSASSSSSSSSSSSASFLPAGPDVAAAPSPNPLNPSNPLNSPNPPNLPNPPLKLPRVNERRSRVTFAVIVFLAFLILSVAGSVIGSAILGFVMTGLYRAGNFHMSTWIPFLLALMQVLIGLLSVWPSIIEII